MSIDRVLVLLAVLASLTLGGGAGAQNSVELRNHARAALDGPVLLASVAKVEGPDADAIGRVRLAERAADLLAGRSWHVFDPEAIHVAIEQADSDALWGLVRVSGSGCHVGALLDAHRVAASGDQTEADTADALPSGAQVRDAVVQKLARTLSVTPQDLRVSFRETDESGLDRVIRGKSVTVMPLGMSQTMPIRIHVYERNGSMTETTVRASIEIRRSIVRLNKPIARGRVVLPEDIVADTAWVSPDLVPVSKENATGSLARRKLDAGAVLAVRDLERPVLIGRGELVRVHCISGSLVIESEARALQDGREGETIELEPTIGGGQFRATVRGRGRASITLGTSIGLGSTEGGTQIGGLRIISK